MEANFWVIAHGVDCDGCNDGSIYPFNTKEEADDFSDESNEWSDGIQHSVIDSVDELMKYCSEYSKDFTNYLSTY